MNWQSMTSPSTSLALARSATIALALGSLASAASCMVCNEIACGGGFEWQATPEDDTPVVPGAYRLAIELDDVLYEFDCTITERARESECVGPADESADEFEIDIEMLSRQTTEEWDRDAPVGSIMVNAWAFEGEDDRSTRGPRDIHIVLERDGATLVDVPYAIEYDRDEDFFGNERCGFCDQLESRTKLWSEG